MPHRALEKGRWEPAPRRTPPPPKTSGHIISLGFSAHRAEKTAMTTHTVQLLWTSSSSAPHTASFPQFAHAAPASALSSDTQCYTVCVRARARVGQSTCDDNEPAVGATDCSGGDCRMADLASDACDGTVAGSTCTHMCDAGYESGSITCVEGTADASDGAFSVVACSEVLCNQPDITGYTVTNTQLNVVTGFAVTAACATGYESTGAGPAATTCGATSGAYSLSGCSAVVCEAPADITGYDVTETELNVATGFAVTVACADAYESTGAAPAAASCGAASGAYSLSGCGAVVCTEPADITGYTVTNTQLSVATGFDVTPQCATGYEGSPAVAACTT
eukprot:COSAG06_NODE_6165_length_3074_cov_7.266218_4_plen_335_part_01